MVIAKFYTRSSERIFHRNGDPPPARTHTYSNLITMVTQVITNTCIYTSHLNFISTPRIAGF